MDSINALSKWMVIGFLKKMDGYCLCEYVTHFFSFFERASMLHLI